MNCLIHKNNYFKTFKQRYFDYPKLPTSGVKRINFFIKSFYLTFCLFLFDPYLFISKSEAEILETNSSVISSEVNPREQKKTFLQPYKQSGTNY